jgi:hypothetical protein
MNQRTTAWSSTQVVDITQVKPFHSYYISQSGTTETYASPRHVYRSTHELFTEDQHNLLLYSEVKLQIKLQKNSS